MSLREQIDQDMKSALKNKEKIRLSVIRMLKSSIKKAEIEKRKSLSDDEVLGVIVREVKQRQESFHEFEKAGRADLAQKEKEEMKILQSYLPEPLSEEEVRALIEQVIVEVGATSRQDIGKVMSAIMPKVKGRADGRLVNRLVQQFLS